MSPAKIEPESPGIQVALDSVLPLRCPDEKSSRRYRAVLASIREIGLVEPLLVRERLDAPGKYDLLDGHQRFFALRELGQTRVGCTIVTDKEKI
jgi:ParB-like chromosome segregation protein Spo0J